MDIFQKNLHYNIKFSIYRFLKKYRKLLILYISFFIFLNIDQVFAVTTSEEETAIREQERIEQKLETEKQEQIQQNKFFEIEKIRKTRDFETEAIEEKMFNDGSFCIKVKEITLKGNSIYSTKKLRKKFLDNHINQCLTKSAINNLKNDMENFYMRKSYTLARVYFDFTKLNKNILSINIYEGLVNKIEIEDSKKKKQNLWGKFKNFRSKTQIFTAFPFKKNKPFNLRDFEQGLDQMNRLASNNAKLDLRPAEQKDKEGYTDVIINNDSSLLTSIKLGYDNGGSKNTGKERKKLNISQDNLFALNDNIYISYIENKDDNGQSQKSESFYSSLSIPFGYWTGTASYSETEYLSTIQGDFTTFKSSGDTITQNYGIDRIIFRSQKFKTGLGVELDVKETNSYIEDVKSETGSRKLSIATISSSNTLYTRAGTFYIKPSYVRGQDWFNAKSDERDTSQMSRSTPRAQFEIFKLYSYWNTNFYIPKTKIPLNYMLTFNGQSSQDALFGSEQFSVGGQYSVRGFSESSISGDNGYNIRNDLKINTVNLLPQSISQSNLMLFGNKYGISVSNALSRTYLTLFYDYGYTRNHEVLAGYTDEGYMSGTGIALNYNGKYLDWDLTYSKGLHSPEYLRTRDNINKDDETIYFNINVGF